MKLFRRLIKVPKVLILMLIGLILIGVISANGNFKVGTDGKMECNGAKITGGEIYVEDTGNENDGANIVAESTNYQVRIFSNQMIIDNKNYQDKDMAIINPTTLSVINGNSNGFQFDSYEDDGTIMWRVSDVDGNILQAGNGAFNLWNPGRETNLKLNANGAYINGYKIQTNTSDAKLKDNIQDSIENALEKIMKIRHRSFEWKESGEHQKNGYIAQELEEIDREFVINENDKYSINVLNLLATVTKAMQEQQKQIENLQKEIENMKGAK